MLVVAEGLQPCLLHPNGCLCTVGVPLSVSGGSRPFLASVSAVQSDRFPLATLARTPIPVPPKLINALPSLSVHCLETKMLMSIQSYCSNSSSYQSQCRWFGQSSTRGEFSCRYFTNLLYSMNDEKSAPSPNFPTPVCICRTVYVSVRYWSSIPD